MNNYFNIEYLSKNFENILDTIATNSMKLIIGLLVLLIGFKVIRKIINNFVLFLEKREIDITLIRFLESLLGTGLKVLLSLTILVGYWGIELTGLTAILTSAGVAIGLALQGSLSNFAGGFIILLIRPFKVGDYIETGIYGGTVEQIGLFYTQLTTIDNKLILIPNGTLSNGSLINYSAKESRRVDMTFSVGYENDVIKVKNVLTDIINKNKLILDNPENFIGISAHGPSSVDFIIKVWCKTEDYWTIYFELLEQVKIRFDEENISIPYPQMDVHFKNTK